MPNQESINISLIGGKLEHLDGLCRAKKLAADEFKEACKAVGQESRCEASVLAKFINARVAESTDKDAKNTEQLSFLYDNLRKYVLNESQPKT